MYYWRDRLVACSLNIPRGVYVYVPGMLEWFDFFDLNAALAPRPYILTEGGRTRDLLNQVRN